jgi:hypothetical protein
MLDNLADSTLMRTFLARQCDPLRTLREIEADGPHPLSHAHYAASVTHAIRVAMDTFSDGSLDTVGDGVYQTAVIIAGRRHLVTVQPEPMKAKPEQVAA